jgi:hypothetical protein
MSRVMAKSFPSGAFVSTRPPEEARSISRSSVLIWPPDLGDVRAPCNPGAVVGPRTSVRLANFQPMAVIASARRAHSTGHWRQPRTNYRRNFLVVNGDDHLTVCPGRRLERPGVGYGS